MAKKINLKKVVPTVEKVQKTPEKKTILKKVVTTKPVIDKKKFSFIIKPKTLAKTEVKLPSGGKVNIEFLRNVGDGAKIVPVPNTRKDDSDSNWTCSTEVYNGEVYSKDIIILNSNFPSIYPGAVYPFETIAKGEYKPLPYARKPIQLTTPSTSGFKNNLITVNNPNMGEINQAITNMKSGAILSGKAMVGKSFEVLSEEDLFMRTGGSGHYLGFGGKHNISYNSNKKTHKYLVEMYQTYYDIVVNDDISSPQDFFILKSEEPNNPKALDDKMVDPNWVYVKSVSYGRVLYILYECDQSFSSFGIDVEAYANFGFAGGEANLSYKQRSFLKSTSVSVATIGGPLIESAMLLNSSSFKDLQKRIDNYLKVPGGEAIIAYSLKTLDQADVGARMVTQFTSRKCAPRASKYKVTWHNTTCIVNDDSGSAEEIRASVRIRAFDGKGNDILDIDKKNKKVVEYYKLDPTVRKLVGAPWTFTEGSKKNPVELKEGGMWESNKSLTFKIPMDDPNARIGIRADVLEFDDTSADDQFASNPVEIKVSELSILKKVNIECRHEASRILIMLTIIPIYD